MTLWQQKRWLRYIIITFGSLLMLMLAGLSALFITLSCGLVDLQFLKTYLSSEFKASQHQHGFYFDSLILQWKGFGEPLIVEGKNVNLTSNKSPIKRLVIPHLVFKFYLRQVF